jgi:lipopolysaccharide biosynthesis protein
MVQQIVNAGVDVVIASTSEFSLPMFGQPRNMLSNIPTVARENRGFDFASWAETILMFRDEVESLDELYLVNSSMYGPFAPLDSFFTMNGNDVTALTNSNEFLSHAQSYFLGFSKSSLQHQSFWNFFGSVPLSENKWATIISSELTWLHYFQSSGFSSNILFPVEKSQRRNPLTFGWIDLLNRGFPFIKKSLFLQNYDRIAMRGWQKVINEISPDFDVELIERDIWQRSQ